MITLECRSASLSSIVVSSTSFACLFLANSIALRPSSTCCKYNACLSLAVKPEFRLANDLIEMLRQNIKNNLLNRSKSNTTNCFVSNLRSCMPTRLQDSPRPVVSRPAWRVLGISNRSSENRVAWRSSIF